MAYQDKLDSMTRALAQVEGHYAELVPLYGTDLAASMRQTKAQAELAIRTLKGIAVSVGDINPWQRALEDDEYLRDAWLPLAEQTDANICQALGYQSQYSVSNFFIEGFNNIGDAVQDAAPSGTLVTTGIGFAAIGLIAIAVIVVFK